MTLLYSPEEEFISNLSQYSMICFFRTLDKSCRLLYSLYLYAYGSLYSDMSYSLCGGGLVFLIRRVIWARDLEPMNPYHSPEEELLDPPIAQRYLRRNCESLSTCSTSMKPICRSGNANI